MQGITQSQISFRETKQILTPSKKQLPTHSGSKLHTNAMEKQPTAQNSSKSAVSHILQVLSGISKRSEHITISKSFYTELLWHRNRFRNTFQYRYKCFKEVSSFSFQRCSRILSKKGEVMLSFPIDFNQFQQFCKQLNTKQIFLCRDLLEK